ncbi:MAG: VanW family protein, partial [Desulfotomaculaceae bacterium]
QSQFGPLEKGAQDACLTINNDDRVEVVPSLEGYAIDLELLTESLINQSVISNSTSINVPMKITQPEVTTEQVREWGVTGLLAEFSTRFNPTQANRNHNIATAAGKMDGLIVGPGEVFSFNRAVGSRGIEQGYRMANVIVGNKLEEGLGGGVCQVSTTLYNAVLLADLAVEQRSNHSIPISYAPVGRDAAVAYDFLDLKFKNNLDSHVLIKTLVRNSDLTVKIYGAPNPDKKVQLSSWITKTVEPKTVYEIDPAVEPGNQEVVQQGANGYTAAAERLVLVNGLEVKRELLFGSKYQSVEHIIAVHSQTEIPQTEPGEGNPVEEKQEDVDGDAGEPAAGETDPLPDELPSDSVQQVLITTN